MTSLFDLLRRSAACLTICLTLTMAGQAFATELSPWRGAADRSLSLDRMDGGRLQLDDFRGRIVVVHFFATWCEPCRREMTALEQLAQQDLQIPIAFMAVDVGEPDDRVRRFFQSVPVSFPIALDRAKATAKAWEIDLLPSTIVLDKALQPCLRSLGDFSWDKAATVKALTESCQGM